MPWETGAERSLLVAGIEGIRVRMEGWATAQPHCGFVRCAVRTDDETESERLLWGIIDLLRQGGEEARDEGCLFTVDDDVMRWERSATLVVPGLDRACLRWDEAARLMAVLR